MASPPILVKRYGQARIYDAANRRYVTVRQLREWRRKGIAFVVRDAETGLDVTAALLS